MHKSFIAILLLTSLSPSVKAIHVLPSRVDSASSAIKEENDKGIIDWIRSISKKTKKTDGTDVKPLNTMKFGGYITTKATLTDQKGKTTTNFGLRLFRLYLTGHAFTDFYYKVQLEATGAPGIDKGPRILDAFVEWQKLDYLKFKIGQFKRSFGFENPMSPWVTGFGAFSQASNKIASVAGDFSGEHSSSGRDMGMQLQGDFWKAKDGHPFVHYQVGLFNGQGINHLDKDNHKDLIAGIWFSPIKKMRIGAFGWNGKYTNEGFTKEKNNIELPYVDRKRWDVGFDYESDWVIRSEYMQSYGKNIKKINSSSRQDGWYMTVGVPVVKKLKIFTRWDCFREQRSWAKLVANYGVAANYLLSSKLQLQLTYNLTNHRATVDHYSNEVDFLIYAKF